MQQLDSDDEEAKNNFALADSKKGVSERTAAALFGPTKVITSDID